MSDKQIIIANSMVYHRRVFGHGKKMFTRLINTCFPDVPVFYTDHPAHATFIAQENTNAGMIIVAGGDGTISEVINGMDLDRQVLGVIPMGTGNSLARQTGMFSINEAINRMMEPRVTRIDVLECSMTIGNDVYKRYAVATSGFEYVSNVTDIGNIWFKGAGKLCYVISSFFAFLCKHTLNAEVTIDEEFCLMKRLTNVIINNTNFSGNFRIFNDSLIDDGKLSIMYSFNSKIQQLVQNFGILLGKRWHIKSKFQKAEKLYVEFEKPTKFMIDGEIFDNVLSVTFQSRPNGLKYSYNSFLNIP